MEPRQLKQFFVATKTLRDALQEDLRLNDFDRISLENYMSLLELTYIEWKRRNVQSYRQTFPRAA